MRSLWNDLEAREFQGDLGLRVYTSRLLGRDKSLVLHGGGNTSVKIREKNLFGEEETILYVKGSGWDLETIEPQGFSPVRLAHVLRLAELPALSDPEMVNQLVTHMLKAAAPAPSIETILHGLMPLKFVDHTHADAVLSVTNTKDGERRIREIYGKRCVVIPYLIPGFDLAQLCAREFKRQSTPETVGMVLLNHGIFSFGETAREAYERMVELVTLAEDYLDSKNAWLVVPNRCTPGKTSVNAQADLRRKLSDAAGSPLILKTVTNERTLSLAQHPQAATITQQGPATPDHVIRTKRTPMLGTDVDRYVAEYGRYFGEHAPKAKEPKTMLDPAPRVVLDPAFGLAAAGRTAKDAVIVDEIYGHTIDVILRAEALGGFQALPPKDIFDVENVLRRQRLEAAKRFGAQDYIDSVAVDLVHDHRILCGAARSGQPECGIEHDTRRGIEHGLGLLRFRRVLSEVSLVLGDVASDVRAEHGRALGADDVIGRRRSLLRDGHRARMPRE